MIDILRENLEWMRRRVDQVAPFDRIGRVVRVTSLVIESEGPAVALGDTCKVVLPRRETGVTAEVVGFRDNHVLLMPLTEMHDIQPGCKVVAGPALGQVPVSNGLMGRIMDGLGNPLDDRGPIRADAGRGLNGRVPNPLKRMRIEKPLQTGVRAIDVFAPLGCGQRIGLFAGSGVGKSTLLGMITRGAESEVNVIALIGERGRELREFIEADLGAEGLSRSVVVVSTSNQPAPLRLRAAFLATSIAEDFRDAGRRVLFLMDSLTRFAMAQREIRLAVGEPPTSRGYTPSVFSAMPRLLERTGMGESGSITAIYTVLVEGDDLNEPVSDAVRGILDGHVVLSRSLANTNHYPAIDVLGSVSRLERQVCSKAEVQLVSAARDLLATYARNEDLITIGAYPKNSNPEIDRAIEKHGALRAFLTQRMDDLSNRDESFRKLEAILK